VSNLYASRRASSVRGGAALDIECWDRALGNQANSRFHPACKILAALGRLQEIEQHGKSSNGGIRQYVDRLQDHRERPSLSGVRFAPSVETNFQPSPRLAELDDRVN
jgi:hypothetical protein